MDNVITINKTIYSLVDEFFSTITNKKELHILSKKQINVEVLKRIHTIAEQIRRVAENIAGSNDINEKCMLAKQEIQNLAEAVLKQDFVECALNFKNEDASVNLSEDELCSLLFEYAANKPDCPVSNMIDYCGFSPHLLDEDHSSPSTVSTTEPSSKSFSLDIEKSVQDFEKDVIHLQCAFNRSLLIDESNKTDDKNFSESGDSFSSVDSNHPATLQQFLESENRSDDTKSSQLSFNCWERMMKQSIPCHLYTSELTSDEVSWNITDQDSYAFRTLFDPSGAVPESDLVRDVLYLVVGIPSDTFYRDESKNQFFMKPFTRLENVSPVATQKLVQNFIDAGTIFHALSNFSSSSTVDERGLVHCGLRSGVRAVLSMFSEYIASVTSSRPSLHAVRKDVAENCTLITTLGLICGFQFGQNTFKQLPKGIGLLTYLNHSVSCVKNRFNSVLLAALLKFIYEPYFRFLESWMLEGVFCDEYDEFEIVQDDQHVHRRDELFWDHAFSLNTNKSAPKELEKFSYSVLQCGKSMQLIRSCCPKFESFDHYSSSTSLSLAFSHRALHLKKQNNILESNDSLFGPSTSEDTSQTVISLFPPGSFGDSLFSLVISKPTESKEEICIYLWMTPLQNVLQYNFDAIFSARMHSVQRSLTSHLKQELKLVDFFRCLQNAFLLQDEVFSTQLCRKLFNRAVDCPSLASFVDWSVLNNILVTSLSVPAFADTQFAESGTLFVVPLAAEELFEKNEFFKFYQFGFKVEWPLNILLPDDLLPLYTKICSFLLEIDFLCWLLAEVWRRQLLQIDGYVLNDSPQYRKMMLDRFMMHQFIRLVRNCIYEDLGGPLWSSFHNSLQAEELTVDAIRDLHTKHLQKALARCFLTPDTRHLRDTLRVLLRVAYRFSVAAMDCDWQKRDGVFETSRFEEVDAYQKTFVAARDQFYNLIIRDIYKFKHPESWDNLYVPFLEAIFKSFNITAS